MVRSASLFDLGNFFRLLTEDSGDFWIRILRVRFDGESFPSSTADPPGKSGQWHALLANGIESTNSEGIQSYQ